MYNVIYSILICIQKNICMLYMPLLRILRYFIKINWIKLKIMFQKFCQVNYFIIIAWFKEFIKIEE